MIVIYLSLLVSWTVVCVLAGKVCEAKRQEREDMEARDAWANQMEQRFKQEW